MVISRVSTATTAVEAVVVVVAVHHGDLHHKTVIRVATMAATHGDRRETNNNNLHSHQITTTPTSRVVHSSKVQITTTRHLVAVIATTPAAATTATGEILSRHPADLVKLPVAMHSGRLSEVVQAVQEAINSRIDKVAVVINATSRQIISNSSAAEVDNLQTAMAEVIHDKPWTFRNNFELFFTYLLFFFPLTL